MTIEQLKTYCSTDETRPGILEPWSYEDRTFATDGRIAVWVSLLPEVPERPEAPAKQLVNLIAENPLRSDPLSIPELPEHQFDTCDICCEGKFIVDHHTHQTAACPECDGEWRWRRGIAVTVGDQLISDIYLEKIKALPDHALFNSSKGKLCAAGFTFDGGSGLIMPMRK